MWGGERSPRKSSVNFIDIEGVSDALTIYDSRSRLHAGEYDGARDEKALRTGLKLMETPDKPLQR
ncbi:MAG: hypothetical protein ACREGC_03880, partial [Minisyncoccia bacterium]